MRGDTGVLVIASGGLEPVETGQCNYLYCYDQTGLIEVALFQDKREIEAHTLERFVTLNNRSFDEIQIRDKSGASNSVRLFFGKGTYEASQDRANVTLAATEVQISNQPTVDVDSLPPVVIDDEIPVDVVVSGPVAIDDSTPVDVNLAGGSVTLNQSNIGNGALDTPDDSIAATSTEQIVTASADNVLVVVTNPPDSGETLRIGTHSAVDSDTGTPLPPGATWERLTQAGVWVYNPGAGAVSVAVEVETRT